MARQVWWYSLISVVVTVFLMALVGAWWTQRQIDQFGKKLCETTVRVDEAFNEPLPPGTPNTPTRQQLAAAYREQRAALHCDE